jgi:hypothetical protein
VTYLTLILLFAAVVAGFAVQLWRLEWRSRRRDREIVRRLHTYMAQIPPR